MNEIRFEFQIEMKQTFVFIFDAVYLLSAYTTNVDAEEENLK